jgi:hypothetical protein
MYVDLNTENQKMCWNRLAQDEAQWRDPVCTVVKLWVPPEAGYILTNWETIRLLIRALLF